MFILTHVVGANFTVNSKVIFRNKNRICKRIKITLKIKANLKHVLLRNETRTIRHAASLHA